jgi:hypothetical protein
MATEAQLLLLVPEPINESYFAQGRILYEVVPTVGSALALLGSALVWRRTGSRVAPARLIGTVILLAFAAVVTFCIGLVIFAGIKQG